MIKVTRTTKVLEGLMKRMKALQKANVTSGYHADAGTHPIIGESFASLMFDHEYGYSFKGREVVTRPVAQETMAKFIPSKNLYIPEISRYVSGEFTLNKMLNSIGMELTETAKSIFGDTSILTSTSRVTQANKGGVDTPLIDSGELRDAWIWKVKL